MGLREVFRKDQHVFNQRHEEYMSRYRQNLPPPHPSLNVVTVIPSYAELNNDNFWRMLSSASRQRGVATDEFEVLYVVNNHKSAPKAPLDSRKRNCYDENQQHLSILRRMQEGSEGKKSPDQIVDQITQTVPNITPYEQSLVRAALQRGVRVYGIDASSANLALSDKNCPTGLARDIGGHIAFERLRQVGCYNYGFIDYIDGDCFLPSNYYFELIDLARGDFEVLIKPLLTQTPEYPRSMEEIEDDFGKLLALAMFVTKTYVHNYIDYIPDFSVDTGFIYTSRIHGPSIAIQPKRFKDIEGYFSRIHRFEDYEFARAAVNSGSGYVKYGYLSNSHVYLSNRGRPESCDGYSKNDIAHEMPRCAPYGFEQERHYSSNRSRFDLGAYAQIDKLLTLNKKMEGRPQQNTFLEQRKRFYRLERIKRMYFIEGVRDLVNQVAQAAGVQEGIDSKKVLEDVASEYGMRFQDYLKANPMLVEVLVAAADTAKKQYSSPVATEQIMSLLEEYFPEALVQPLADEPDYDIDRFKQKERDKEKINIRDYLHIILAAYAVYAREHNEKQISEMVEEAA
jgi:hypothetical protein